MKKSIIVTILSSVIIGCSSGPKLPSQNAPEAELYQQRCSGCHEPVPAEKFHTFQWERLLTLLERQLEPYHQEMATPLSTADKELLLHYLKRYSKPDEESTVEQLQEQSSELKQFNKRYSPR